MTDLIGATAGLVSLVGLLVFLVLAGFLPLMVWSAVRSLKGIRHELERMNDNLDRRWIIEGDVHAFKKAEALNIR